MFHSDFGPNLMVLSLNKKLKVIMKLIELNSCDIYTQSLWPKTLCIKSQMNNFESESTDIRHNDIKTCFAVILVQILWFRVTNKKLKVRLVEFN